jgi:hypothetical protein
MIIIKDGWLYEIEVTLYHPARPAPSAQTPDSPGYDDPGDDGEIEYNVLSIQPDEDDTEYCMLSAEDLDQLVWEEQERET